MSLTEDERKSIVDFRINDVKPLIEPAKQFIEAIEQLINNKENVSAFNELKK
ncbi:MAG: hypothetical protein LBT24_00625 [Tannerella sp.]|jgi:hypothetical protein|nr:hypothetical protein [Tannerella sp.]